jgi:hypothetical protein
LEHNIKIQHSLEAEKALIA